jgi:hypothetical protein
MHEAQGFLLDARTAWIVLGAWLCAVLIYGFWRSTGEARQNAIRESGPIF